MTTILNIKENMRTIYSKNSMYILPLLKFLACFVTLYVLNYYIGYSATVNSPLMMGLLSLLCAVLPVNVTVTVYAVVMLLNMLGISRQMAIVTLILLVIMYLIYFRFSAKYGYVMLFMPFLFVIKMPFLMPLIVGISMQPGAVVAMAFGILMFYMMKYGSNEALLMVNDVKSSGLDKISSFITELFNNKEMIVFIIAFSLAALIVYGIKRLAIDNSSTIGIITGGVVEVIIILCAVYTLDLQGMFSLWMIWLFTLVSIALALLLQVFILAVDYSATEYTQFEDDDYYYYVKAVPKIKVTATDVKVKHINVKKTRK